MLIHHAGIMLEGPGVWPKGKGPELSTASGPKDIHKGACGAVYHRAAH